MQMSQGSKAPGLELSHTDLVTSNISGFVSSSVKRRYYFRYVCADYIIKYPTKYLVGNTHSKIVE